LKMEAILWDFEDSNEEINHLFDEKLKIWDKLNNINFDISHAYYSIDEIRYEIPDIKDWFENSKIFIDYLIDLFTDKEVIRTMNNDEEMFSFFKQLADKILKIFGKNEELLN
ncbi:MAG: hypothetical protein MHPSP_004188, partial [Paramarteilia canceri]